MQFVFFIFGAAAALLFIINNLARTALRQRRITFLELLLAFFVLVMPLVALLLDNQTVARFDQLEQATLLIIIPLTIISIGITVVEAFIKGLRYSRGIFGIGIALLLLIATGVYNFLSLNNQLSNQSLQVVPTPVNSQQTGDPCQRAFLNFFFGALELSEAQTGLSSVELINLFFEGADTSLRDLVEANGNSATPLTITLIEYVETGVQDLLALECLPQEQAVLAISQSRLLARTIVTTNFSSLGNLFGGGDDVTEGVAAAAAAEEGTATVEALQATVVALAENPDQFALPTATITATPTLSPTPTFTRVPRATASATPTRPRFNTATPTLTPTLPNPCLASASFNVNMRDFPDLEDSNVLIVIPFEEAFSVFGPNADQTWWYGRYQDEAGWVSAEFIRLTAPCFDLPVRQP